jgi:hypothetical protein
MEARFSYSTLSKNLRFSFSAGALFAALLPPLALGAGFLPLSLGPLAALITGALLFVPIYLLRAANYSNKPHDLGKEDWREVGRTELDRLLDRLNTVKKTQIPFIYTANFNVTIVILWIVASAAIVIFNLSNIIPAIALCGAILLVLFPLAAFARVDKFIPGGLVKSVSLYEPLLRHETSQTVRLCPKFRFDEDAFGKSIPEDLQPVLKKYKDNKPDDALVGVQFQCSINNGESGEVPYIYAVAITNGTNSYYKQLKAMRFEGIITEAQVSQEAGREFGTVVFRQDTHIRRDGYHTKPADVARLTDYMYQAIEGLKEPPVATHRESSHASS